jgi:hypothetical protein
VHHLGAIGLEHIGNDPGGRGFTIRSGNHDRPTRELGSNFAKELWIDPIRHQPGSSGSTAAS